MAILTTSLFILTIIWFCSLAFCSPLCQLEECAQRKETTQLTKHVSSVKRHFVSFNCLVQLFCTAAATGEIEQESAGKPWVLPLVKCMEIGTHLSTSFFESSVLCLLGTVFVCLCKDELHASILGVECFLLLTSSKFLQRNNRQVYL